MNKNWIATGAVLGALAVVLGAFAAHGLKKILPTDAVAVFETGARYQMYHAFTLIAIGAFYYKLPFMKIAALLIIAGIVFFSGSLYLITYMRAMGGSLGALGIITPIGGVLLIAGWLTFAVGALQMK